MGSNIQTLTLFRNLKRFECSIEPRSMKIAELIQQLDLNVDINGMAS